MDTFLHILRLASGPLMGMVIGIFTNYIAVKMLFRPRRPKHLFGMKIPFTPGIIPARKPALAKAVGKAVGESLVKEEDICRIFLSEEILGVITQKALELPSLGEIGDGVLHEEYPEKMEKVVTFLENKIIDAIREIDPAELIAREGSAAIKGYAAGNPLVRMFVNDALIASLTAPIGEKVNEYLETTGREMIHGKLSDEMAMLETKQVADLVGGEEVLTMLVRNAFVTFFGAFAADIAKHFHISEIVEEKMNAMPPEELEELVLSVMKKELSTVVWLGGVLGFLMGLVNLALNYMPW